MTVVWSGDAGDEVGAEVGLLGGYEQSSKVFIGNRSFAGGVNK